MNGYNHHPAVTPLFRELDSQYKYVLVGTTLYTGKPFFDADSWGSTMFLPIYGGSGNESPYDRWQTPRIALSLDSGNAPVMRLHLHKLDDSRADWNADYTSATLCYDCSYCNHTVEAETTTTNITSSVIQEPTNTRAGIKRYTARFFFNNERLSVDVEIPRNSSDEISVTIDDGIGVNFLLALDDPSREGADSVTATYKAFDGSTVTETYTKSELSLQPDGKYKLTVRIAPAQLADEITVRVGSEDAIGTSVLEYCETLRNGDQTAAVKAVAYALEQYAQAANVTFGYAADAITDISTLNKEAVKAYTGAVYSDGTGKVCGASFMALTKPEFRFYTAGIDEQTAYDYNQAGISVTMAGGTDTLNARFVKKANGDILLEVTGVSAQNMDKTITVTIIALGQTITFNGNAFAKAMALSSSETQQNLGAALFNYGEAANACWPTGE